VAETNVEAFTAAVGAVANGDAEAGLVYIDPDVVFEPLRSATEGNYVGHDGIRRFVADTQETFDVFEPDFRDIRDLGDRVLAIGSIRVRGHASGAETDIPTAAVAWFRDGLLYRYKDYGEAKVALEAAGLRE
jgi:ketosteroid isomerase-like protein